MSVMQSQRLMPLQFFRSSAAPCPYLPGRIERKLFARLGGPDTEAINSVLSESGFRRSHDIIYKPACPGCMACVPVRVPVDTFKAQGNLGKIMRRGKGFTTRETAVVPTSEQFDLFLSYESGRHAESDMARMTYDDYVAMLTEGQAATVMLEMRNAEGHLIGVMLADRLKDGWSAVYSFFNTSPEYDRYSLGTLLILELIEHSRQNEGGYVYLGYWVKNSRKMDYKARFHPLEQLTPEGWKPFSE